MNSIEKNKIATWSMRIITIIMIAVWVFIILKIANTDKPFIAQAPYCMVSTFTIFAILSLVQK